MRQSMLKRGLAVLAAMGALLPAGAQQTTAPAAGSPGIYLPHMQIERSIDAATAKQTNPALGTIGETDQYFIHQVHRTQSAPAAIHPGWTELHYILAGSGTFVTGGKLKDSLDGKGRSIEGGEAHKVSKGDAVIVPANTPHWYQSIDGSLDELEVRFIAQGAPAAPK
jgi:mannose-6-phosphate isomerase-like protein (cupin superfamily)